MNLTLPNGGCTINATTITIDARGTITCTGEVVSKMETTTEPVNRFCTKSERLMNRQSEKSYTGTIRNMRIKL